MSKPANLVGLVEATLFVSTSPVSASELAKKLEISAEDTHAALSQLKKVLQDRGITLIESSTGYELAVAPQLREKITVFTKEVAPTLSQSSLEVLTIIAYEGPCTKNLIDEIRGTPSDNSLRALLSRDLVSQSKTSNTEESISYELTSFAWRSLGITGKSELPPKPRSKKAGSHATQ
ncbi:MAG: segregation and condensation protein [Patescibacteria group bacterium]|nr:segregation and condensation protein [Patescibacteria group bacterium]